MLEGVGIVMAASRGDNKMCYIPNNINALVVKTDSKPRFVQYPGNPNDYYMMVDGVDNMLEIYHTIRMLCLLEIILRITLYHLPFFKP